jgi:hypothetical protein
LFPEKYQERLIYTYFGKKALTLLDCPKRAGGAAWVEVSFSADEGG